TLTFCGALLPRPASVWPTLVTLAQGLSMATMPFLINHFRPAMHANTPPSSYWWPIVAAATALIVVHGFGRFVYTPLLPLLVDDGLISLPQAASLATWNYIGYLTGAMLALFLYQRGFGRQALLSMLVGNALITLIQVWATYYPLLAGLRLLNGIGNGVVFVLAPALVLEWLVTQSKAHHSGLMYLSVGVGIL